MREEPIEPARIERAYARFLRQRAAAPARRWAGVRLVRFATIALVMAVGTVYAATLIHPLVGGQPSEPLPPADAPQAPPPSPAPRATVQEAPQQEVAASPEEEPPAAAPAAPTASVRAPVVRSPGPVASAEQWKRAAEGLRDGDYRRADAALKELRRSGTEADRESALLVQAQVLLAQGREAEARSLLKSLEASARAPSVRRKAVELLTRLRERPAARSEKARGVTEAP